MNIFEIYKKVDDFVNEKYSFLGLNRKREIKRLIFEISKKRKIFDPSFVPEFKNYNQFKRELLKIRYPYSIKEYSLNSFYLPNLELNEKEAFNPDQERNISEIIVEKKYLQNIILEKLKNKFPKAKFRFIDSFKEIKKFFSIENYNRRVEKIYIVEEVYDLLKNCPCTKRCISCNYYVLNLNFGCPMECQYCYLQSYQNFNGIIINPNIDDYINVLKSKFKNLKRKIRVGNGEFSDSLYYDDISEYSIRIIDGLKDLKNIYFEFKTKTDNVDNFFKVKPSENIVVSYSLNPDEIIKKTEFFTTSMDMRIECLKRLSNYGYNVGVHFDPIIKFDNWQDLYYKSIKTLFDNVDLNKIKWISIGSFRFAPETKKVIEKRFPDNIILDEEMIIDFDGKLRYPYSFRLKIYKTIIEFIKSFGYPLERIYLCMEKKKIWDEVGLKYQFRWEDESKS